jgi:hypothetical protein
MHHLRLDELCAYENPELIARFCKDYDVSEDRARLILKDLLRYFWLTVRLREVRGEGSAFRMWRHYLILDEMWHTFLLYTQEYQAFCEKYFGYFLHHVPTPTLEAGGAKEDSGATRRADLESALDFVWDELGGEVACRWFSEYPDEFPPLKIRALQLKSAEKQEEKLKRRSAVGAESARTATP